jgi:hypothetical protein
MRSILYIIVAALSLMTSGMAATETQQAAPQNHTDTSTMQSCPMKVPGTDLSITDAENGIALTLTTKSGELAELRRRVENMAKMHSASSNNAMHGNMMPFSIKYEEVAYGARLTLTPKNPAELDAFRATVRRHAEQMKQGNCPMMQAMMRGMMENAEPKATPEPKAKPEDEDHSAHHPPGEKK